MRRFVLAFCLILCLAGQAHAAIYRAASDVWWPPFEYANDNGEIVGYSIDYLQAVADASGLDVIHLGVPWDGIFLRLRSGEYDIIASSVSATEERRLLMDFSTPYLKTTQQLVVSVDNQASSLAAMPGLVFAVRTGSTGQKAINAHRGVTTKLVDDITDGFDALANGTINGVICDEHVANYFMKDDRYRDKIKAAPFSVTDQAEFYVFVVRKGNKRLLQSINKGIEKVQQEKRDIELRRKWLE